MSYTGVKPSDICEIIAIDKSAAISHVLINKSSIKTALTSASKSGLPDKDIKSIKALLKSEGSTATISDERKKEMIKFTATNPEMKKYIDEHFMVKDLLSAAALKNEQYASVIRAIVFDAKAGGVEKGPAGGSSGGSADAITQMLAKLDSLDTKMDSMKDDLNTMSSGQADMKKSFDENVSGIKIRLDTLEALDFDAKIAKAVAVEVAKLKTSGMGVSQTSPDNEYFEFLARREVTRAHAHEMKINQKILEFLVPPTLSDTWIDNVDNTKLCPTKLSQYLSIKLGRQFYGIKIRSRITRGRKICIRIQLNYGLSIKIKNHCT